MTVLDGFAATNLGPTADAADAGLAAAAGKSKRVPRDTRVTFYYLLAEATGTLGKLA